MKFYIEIARNCVKLLKIVYCAKINGGKYGRNVPIKELNCLYFVLFHLTAIAFPAFPPFLDTFNSQSLSFN